MSRIPYVADRPGSDEPELVVRIRARRGGKLLNLDRMLLNSLPFAHGWNTHLGAVRGELAVPTRLRELAICAVAVLNGADYELAHHAPELLRSGGEPRQLEALKAQEFDARAAGVFDPTELAVLRLTSEMTRGVKVSDATFTDVRLQLGDDQQVVELVGIIATYNMVSRFLVALEVDLEDR